MTRAKTTGWKFIHPDVAAAEFLAPGKKPPPAGMILGDYGSVEQVSDDDAVRQAVLMLLSTRPGERVMRPDYGCNLHQLVFSPNDDTTAGIAIYLVKTALQRWESRIDILELDANPDPQNHAVLVITLGYQVRETKTNEEVQIALDLT